MNRKRQITIREIAAKVGVSIGTVDRVLHNRGRVSPETREKIEALVKKFGYRPNPLARHLKLKKEYQFFILSPYRHEDSGYWGLVFNGIQRAAEELSPFGIHIFFKEFDRYSRESFWKTAHSISLEDCDGLLLAPIIPSEMLHWLNELPSNIPYVFFDATLPDMSPITEIGQDPYNGGFLAGKLLCLFALRERGTYCVIAPHSEDYHIKRRIEGFLAFWANLEGYRTEVRTCSDMDHQETREGFLNSLLQEIPNPKGIFVANSSVHSVAEILNRDNSFHIPIIGYDLVPENERLLREGLIDVLISQRPAYQGYQAVYQLYRHVVLQQVIEKKIPIPIHFYFKENLIQEYSPDLEYKETMFAFND
ncbi:MAG: LacI family transcriptional regulator [Spirochaetes bacterium]|nr:LacI family transcriptional regulator [Spirochaetota bacterium]